jgi:ADP-heptose:LPS heptosyltransferase
MIDYRTMDSICVAFLHGIGDFIMLTPSLKKIRATNPSIKITVVLRKELGIRRLAEGLGFIDDVLELSLSKHPRFYVPWVFWSREYWVIRRGLKELLTGRDCGRTRIIYGQLMPTIVYRVFCPGRMRAHRIDRFASELGISLTRAERNNPEIGIPGDVRERVREKLSGYLDRGGTTIVGIQRNTLDRTRFIDIDEVQQFIDKLNASRENLFFVIFADEASYALEARVDGKHLRAPNLKYSFEIIGAGDSLLLSALVDSCHYVVSVDSAAFNIASALGKKTVGVFNTYKVRSEERALDRDGIQCIDKPDTTAEDLIERFTLLSRKENQAG